MDRGRKNGVVYFYIGEMVRILLKIGLNTNKKWGCMKSLI